MKLRVFLAILLCLPASAQAPAEKQTLTLDEAVRLTLERHPDVGKARAAADALKGKIREVRSQALPQVTITGGGTRWRDPSLLNASGLDNFPPELREALKPVGTNILNYGINVSQPLYTAGKVGTALRLASVEAEGSLAEIDRAQQDLALDVVKAYYGLLLAERSKAVEVETQEQRKLHAGMARSRFQNGVATEVDVLRSEVAVANGAPALVRAENAIRQTRALLNYYVVRPIDFPTEVAGDFQDRPWDEWDLAAIAREADRRRPDLQRLRIAERSAGTQLDLARAENRFRVDFNAAYGIVSRMPSNLFNPLYASWSLGASASLPVFDGFKRSGLVWQATASQRAARLELEKNQQQVHLSLQQGLDEIRAAQETVAAARANIEQADRVLSMTQNNYKYGAATTLDIVDAQAALSVARNNLLRGLHDYSVARANLLWTIGRAPWE